VELVILLLLFLVKVIMAVLKLQVKTTVLVEAELVQ
jgi:hypothetical protein